MSISSVAFVDLSFRHDQDNFLLNQVTFNFPMGEFVWVQAVGGTGRSTLLQLLAALVSPTEGNVYINGENVTQMTFEEFLPFRLQIGYGFDFGGLINNRTIFENLLLPLQYHKLLSYDQAVKQANQDIQEFQLEKYANLRPALVPGGVRKLVCLLRALALYPDLLILDDPTVGLSKEISYKYIEKVKSLKDQGFCRSVYFASYDEHFAKSVPHKVLLLKDGKITNPLEDPKGAAA